MSANQSKINDLKSEHSEELELLQTDFAEKQQQLTEQHNQALIEYHKQIKENKFMFCLQKAARNALINTIDELKSKVEPSNQNSGEF